MCEGEEIGTDDTHVDLIPLNGVDVAQGKLIKLLNAFGAKLSGSARRLANSTRSIIISSQPNNWDRFTENMVIASGINILLHHLCSTVDPHKNVSSAILIESLQDSLNAKYGFEDEWEVVNIAERVNNALLLPSLAALPVVILYLAKFTIDTVFDSFVVTLLLNAGYVIQPVPANSVGVLLPLDNEKERE